MNKRITKKIHTRYLVDIGIELIGCEAWRARLSQLEIGEVAKIENDGFPSSFKKLNPDGAKYKLGYEVKRVAFASIPTPVSCWWQVNNETVYFDFYPSVYKKQCWYVAQNFAR